MSELVVEGARCRNNELRIWVNPLQMNRLTPKTSITLLVAVTVVVFARAVSAQFVLWDDNLHIEANPYLHPVTLQHILFFWKHTYLGLYVPVSYTVFSLLALIAGRPAAGVDSSFLLDPHVFHAANVGIHGANAVLVYLILRALTRRGTASFMGALLFTVHPLQVESVAWVSELRGVLSGLFSLLSIFLYIRFIRWTGVASGTRRPLSTQEEDGLAKPTHARRGFAQRAWKAYGYAFAAFALAILSKPSAAALPIVFVIIDRWCFRRSLKSASMAALPFVLPLLPLVLVTNGIQPIPAYARVPLWKRPLIAGDALAFYMWKLVLPINLVTDYGRRPDFVLGSVWPYIDWLAPASAAVALWRRGSRLVVAGALMALAFLLPVLGFTQFIFQSISTVSDRYCYMAFLGLGLAVAGWLAKRSDKTIYRALIAIMVVFASLSVHQEGYWSNTIALLSHTVSVNPRSGLSYENLGDELADADRLSEALACLKRADQLDPRDARVLLKLGQVAMQLGMPDEAEQAFRKVLDISPRFTDAHYGLGRIYFQSNDTTAAMAEFQQAVKLNPARADARVDLAMILIDKRQFLKARSLLDDGLAFSPRFPALHEALGVDWERLHDPVEAAAELRKSVQLDPSNPESHLLLGLTLIQIGQPRAGQAEVDTARRIFHDPVTFQGEFNSALATLGLKMAVHQS